jgi:hypothetical protein
MGSRRENEYDVLNRGTMQECSSEYQLLREDTMSTIRQRFMARNLGIQKQKQECDSVKAALKKILITMVVVNIMLVLLITVIAVSMAVFSYTRPTTGEIKNDINSLKTEMNQLAAIFLMQPNITNAEIAATIQTNLSRVIYQLDALNRDIISVQRKSDSQQIQIFCGGGDWTNTVSINMSDPLQKCPSAWSEFNDSGIRGCGRPDSDEGMCSANSYLVANQYSRVCGRLMGYQMGSPDGFIDSRTIDEVYMDGVSINTHGTSSRAHIWSYAAGVTERSPEHTPNNCPCSPEAGTESPPFVGENYYCESGNPSDKYEPIQLYPNDPLWDGQQCEGTCCTDTHSPPWFSVRLPDTTTDMIEVRICGDESTSNENTLIEVLDIFVN